MTTDQYIVATRISPAERPALPAPSADVAIGDWEELLGAVIARLRLTVGERPAATADRPLPGTGAWIQSGVLDCAHALDHLHRTLAHELGRRQHLELEVFDARTALALARAELVGTQAGERRARHLARHDSLTALPNRDFFGERLDHALAIAAPERPALAVMFLDLDGFKQVNDTHGHSAGDELLRIVAARLARAVRAEDMVSRLGGDEFGCLLSGLSDREQLGHLACKLLDAVAAPCKIGQFKLSVRASIGIALCPTDGLTAAALLKSADTAMYHAKQGQAGHAFFDQCTGT